MDKKTLIFIAIICLLIGYIIIPKSTTCIDDPLKCSEDYKKAADVNSWNIKILTNKLKIQEQQYNENIKKSNQYSGTNKILDAIKEDKIVMPEIIN